MELVFTGPQPDAVALHRNLRDAGIHAVIMTAADPPSGAVFVPPADAEHARPAIDHTIERMTMQRDAEAEGNGDEDTPKRAPDALYWRAFAAMRTAHARIEPYEQADPALEPDDVEWAASLGLDDIYAVVRAIEAERGTRRIAVEAATEKAAALLMGMRAIALVLANPLADSRGEINGEDPDKQFNATNGIGYLLMLLNELAAEGAAEQWMRADEDGWPRDEPHDEVAEATSQRGTP